MMYPESFADFPVSVTEERGDREEDASLWSPRDAIISLLRDIDAGKIKADDVVICVREQTSPGKCNTWYSASCRDPMIALGLVTSVLFKLRGL